MPLVGSELLLPSARREIENVSGVALIRSVLLWPYQKQTLVTPMGNDRLCSSKEATWPTPKTIGELLTSLGQCFVAFAARCYFPQHRALSDARTCSATLGNGRKPLGF